MRKLVPFFSLILFICIWACSKPVTQQPKLSDIPIIYNIDSLEQAGASMDPKSKDYLMHLITIEWSRLQVRTGLYGQYYKTIDSLSQLYDHNLGKAFIDYASASSSIYTGYVVNHNLMNRAEQALKRFEDNDDPYGIFFSNALISRLYATRVYQRNPADSLDVAQNFKSDIDKMEYHNRVADSTAHVLQDQLLIIYSELHKAKSETTLHIRDKQLEPSKQALLEIIKRIEQQQGNTRHLLSMAHLFYSQALFFQDSLDRTIEVLKSSYPTILEGQYEQKVSFYSQIANCYNYLGQADSSLVYCQKMLDEYGKRPFTYSFVLLTTYENFVENYKSKHQVEKALKYSDSLKFAMSDYFQRLANLEMDNFNFGLGFALEKQKVEERDKQNRLIIIFITTSLILLSCFVLYILKAKRKLQHAYKHIKELQKTRDKFYTIVAHDLRSPLNSYQGLANTINHLLKKQDYAQIQKVSEQIDDMGVSIQLMLGNLFQWSLQEQQGLKYVPELLQLDTTLNDIVCLYTDIATNKKLTLATDIKPYEITTDKNYLTAIVRNLLDNAIKYAVPESAVSINTTLNSDGLHVVVANKAEISASKINTLKELFSSEQEWQPGDKEIGMGLTLVHNLTRAMGSKVIISYQEQVISITLSIPKK